MKREMKEKTVRGSVVDVGARRGGVRANKTVRDEREGEGSKARVYQKLLEELFPFFLTSFLFW